jgi:[protein-PII] uridylyltransferase
VSKIAQSKQQLQALYAAVAKAFDAGESGAALSALMCDGVDELLIDLWQQQAPQAAAYVDLVAVGGYGRGELAPQSDWDLWFLVQESCPAEVEQEMQAFLVSLWDIGAKIGHAVRTVKETMVHVNEDWESATAAMESRLLAGPGDLYGQMQSRLNRFFKRKRKDFVEAKLAELEERHAHTGGTAFLMEPDIKEGKGGLRDVQAAFWIAKAWYGSDDIDGLVEKDALSKRERDQLLRAQDFLWRCRAGLHLEVKRASDRLSFEQQVTLAEGMQYHAIEHRPAVDVFMKTYFRHIGRIARVTGMLFMHFQEQLHPQHFTFTRDIGDGFTLEGQRLGISDNSIFKQDALRLLRVFHAAQQGQRLLSSQALRQIRADVLLIDDEFRANPEAHRIFLQILRSKRNVQWVLREMNDTGILGRFIPEFREVVGLGQFNQYHAYTVDEHTIRAVGEARNFWHRERETRLALANDICQKIDRSELLYIALIFHDIAKGLPGDHSKQGALMAKNFCQRIGLDQDASDLVEWLVLEHLFMAIKSQRSDLSDPEVIRAFAERIGDKSRLYYLLLLSVADIAAVGPNVWNDWKGSLLQQLFILTEQYLLSDETVTETAERLYRQRVETVLAQVDGDTEAIQAALSLLSRQCIMHFPPRHLRQIINLIAANDGDAVNYWADNERTETTFFIVARGRSGLFASLAALLTSGHASIMAAQAYTMADGRVLDVFHLQGADGSHFSEQGDLDRLQSRICRMLQQHEMAKIEIAKPARISLLMQRVPVWAQELPQASYQETAIEVSAADQPRLLARLADVISVEGYELHGSSVSTFGERAVDVFFLTGKESGKLSTEQVVALCDLLMDAARLPEAE